MGRPKSTTTVCSKSIKDFREKSFMTQTDFAKKLNISMRSIQRIENDPSYSVSFKTAYLIANYMIRNPPLNEDHPKVKELLNSWNNDKQ